VYVKPGGGTLSTSTTEAKDDVRTMRWILLPGLAEADKMDLTPLIAGRMSSCSLFVVSRKNGYGMLTSGILYIDYYGLTYAGNMNNAVNTVHCRIEDSSFGKIFYDYKIQL